ncbi:MAG: hypothetical protein QN194_11490 [Armatimonadota bacterium]|nr:hypothetical protein [Armatimonadota bacterium]MDR7573531.1 hypothetical protein [Armatimonadota bacterium]
MSALRIAYAAFLAFVTLLLAAPVLVLALPFWGVALLTRAVARRLEPRAGSWQDLVRFDPVVGWRPRPNVDGHFAERGEVFHVVTDAEGWPGRAGVGESDLVVFGDSIAFGFGVDAARSYREVDPRLRVKSISAPGYNLVQELLLMQEMAPRLAGKLVVWFIYHGNDLYDNLSPFMGPYRTPFVRERRDGTGWEIVTGHLSPAPWRYSAGRYRDWQRVLASLYAPTFLAERAYAACDFLLGEAKTVCDGVGARLVVCTLPSPLALGPLASRLARHSDHPEAFDPDLPDRRIGDSCRAHGIPFVAAKPYLSPRDYQLPDDHWTERGHRRVAEILRSLYERYAASGAATSIAGRAAAAEAR